MVSDIEEDKIRNNSVDIWVSAYIIKGLKWPREKAMMYANKKAYKYLFRNLGRV